MAKDFFKKMGRKEKAEFINRTLEQGTSFRDVYSNTMNIDELAESREMLLAQFKKAGYSVTPDKEKLESSEGKEAQIPSQPMDDRAQLQEGDGRIKDLLQVADELLQMLEWWKNSPARESAQESEQIVLPRGGEDLRKTVRINSQVWEEWKAFCSRHKGWSEKDLLAKALLFYISQRE